MATDVEVAVMDYLDDLGYTVTQTPIDLKAKLPVIRVEVIGGSDDDVNDVPRVLIQTFTAATPANPRAAMLLAEQIRDRFRRELPAMSKPSGGVLFDSAFTETRPSKYGGWPDPAVQVVQSIYRLTIRNT